VDLDAESWKDTAFESVVMGGNVPSNYIPAVEKGFYEVLVEGPLSGSPIPGVRMVLRNGTFLAVD
jgi:elongation factor G